MENECVFSADRRHRYSLIHRINPLLGDSLILWIGLNPSTADESQLDPTLAEPYLAMGIVFFEIQDMQQSALAFEKYLEMRPNAPEAPKIRSLLALMRG